MSEEEEQRLEAAVAACVTKQLNVLFWRGVRWFGIPLGGMGVALTVFYAQLSYHVEDHHERTLIEISADVKHIKADLESVKKSLSEGA
jgi:hypothetical protein